MTTKELMISPMFLLIALLISYAQPMLAAADDAVVDRSPQGFMVRLREAEACDQNDGLERKFIMRPEQAAQLLELRQVIYQCDPEHTEFADYLEYFQALASSRLSDKKKIKNQFVSIPYFQAGTQEQQREKAEFVDDKTGFFLGHVVRRLVYAALCQVELYDAGRKRLVLLSSLSFADAHLTKKVLKSGLDINALNSEDERFIEILFKESRTIAEAQLLLDHGADFSKQQKRADIVGRVCFKNSEESCDLLPFYLDHIQLSEDNQFGQIWFERLFANSFLSAELLYKKGKILLDRGCRCNASSLMKKIDDDRDAADEKKHELKVVLEDLIASDLTKPALDSEEQ